MDTWMVKSYRLSLLIFITYSILRRAHGVSCATGASSIAELQIVAHPKNSTVATGGSATLECKFNMEVGKCLWFEDFFKEVKLSKYNVYSDTRTNGTNTKDCTLIIHSFSRGIDANCFYCVGAKSANSAIASRKGCLSLQAPDTTADPSVIDGPKNASVEEGDSVTLSCTFNLPVLSCGWIRNDRKDLQPIHDRYEYINFGRTTNNSADCSIRINQFKEMDAVHWMCYAQRAQGTTIDIFKSNWAKLTFVPKREETTTMITTTTTAATTTEMQTTKIDLTTLSVTEATTTETPVTSAHSVAGEYCTLVIVATVTLVLVVLLIMLQGTVVYFIKYRMHGYSKYQVDTINLPRIEKQNLLE